MEVTPGDIQINKKRSWIATAITLTVLLLLGLFVGRVLYFANLIRSGEISATDYSFSNSYTTSVKLASAPVVDGIFDLTTDDDPSYGNPDAPVVIVEFADFECPYSLETSSTMRELALEHPEDVYFVYRDFPLSELHPNAQKAAEAGECAQDQDRFWEYHDKLYQNQRNLDDEAFIQFARELNMDTATFERCLTSGKYTDEVIEDYEAGMAAGVRGTPTFFINGNRVAGAVPQEVMQTIVDTILDAQ